VVTTVRKPLADSQHLADLSVDYKILKFDQGIRAVPLWQMWVFCPADQTLLTNLGQTPLLHRSAIVGGPVSASERFLANHQLILASYFSSYRLPGTDVAYQDGGLTFNNPACTVSKVGEFRRPKADRTSRLPRRGRFPSAIRRCLHESHSRDECSPRAFWTGPIGARPRRSHR
jgi:hypothetical protein